MNLPCSNFGILILRDANSKRKVYELNKKSSLAPEAVTNLIDEKLIPDHNPWGNFNFGLMIKMKENQSIEKVQEKIEKLHYENNLMPNKAIK